MAMECDVAEYLIRRGERGRIGIWIESHVRMNELQNG